MDRRNILAFTLSLALAGFLSFGWEWYTTPHDLIEDQPSSLHVFTNYALGHVPELLPPIVLGLLARNRIIFYALLLAVFAVAFGEYFAKFHMIFPQIAAQVVVYGIEYSFIALGAAYLRAGLPSNKSFKPRPLRGSA